MRRIKVFDTTLRDGEQSPGATLTMQEKLIIAKQLEKMRVDRIEAGFPIASDDDFNAVREIAKTVKKSTVVGLARCVDRDIERAGKAIEPAKKQMVHVFLATSPIHMKYKLKKSPKEVMAMAVAGVKKAKNYCDEVEFSAEDATRSDPAFMYSVFEKAIEAGATTINIPDTVGYITPLEYGEIVGGVFSQVDGIENITVSVHCHNDLGLAVANSLEAVRVGAGQVECTINGIGERAGNASLEEIVMAIKMRKGIFNADTGIDTKEIYRASRMVSSFTGIPVQPNKAIVGKNAFAHESGIHQHGVLANREAYEIIDPAMIGKETEIVIGKHSGKHAVQAVLKQLGYVLKAKQLGEVTARIKALADKQKKVMREDIIAIANDVTKQLKEEEKAIVLEEIKVVTGNKVKPTAKVKLRAKGKLKAGQAEGVGPVDAVSKAAISIVDPKIELREYSLKAITGGTDALADVTITLGRSGREYTAEAINEDVIMASTQALIKGMNKVLLGRKKNGRHARK